MQRWPVEKKMEKNDRLCLVGGGFAAWLVSYLTISGHLGAVLVLLRGILTWAWWSSRLQGESLVDGGAAMVYWEERV